MPTTFRPCAPDQSLLFPPSPRDWLPEGHLAFFIADTVAALDLQAFYAPYAGDGRRNQPFDPQMMVTVLLYAYATGTFSSRRIARKLEEDVAYRVLAAGNFPAHRTIAEFRQQHSAFGTVRVGEEVVIQTHDGRRDRVVVQRIERDAIVSQQGTRYAQKDIARIQRKTFSPVKAVLWTVGGIARPSQSWPFSSPKRHSSHRSYRIGGSTLIPTQMKLTRSSTYAVTGGGSALSTRAIK